MIRLVRPTAPAVVRRRLVQLAGSHLLGYPCGDLDPTDDLTARHLAKVVESSDDAIVSKDLEQHHHVLESAPPSACSATPPDEAIGQSIRMLIPEIGRTKKTSCWRRSARARRSIISRPSASARTARLSVDLADRVADPRRRRARSSAPRRSRATSPSGRDCEAAAPSRRENTEKLGEVGAAVASTLDREADRPEGHRHRRPS